MLRESPALPVRRRVRGGYGGDDPDATFIYVLGEPFCCGGAGGNVGEGEHFPAFLPWQGQLPKTYQTRYGVVEVARHVYQRSEGGNTTVRQDLSENHGRECARSYLQDLAEAVGSVAQAKEESWHALPGSGKR